MTRRIAWISSITTLALTALGLTADWTPQGLEQRANAIRPSAAELRWQQVPWLASLVEAQATATREKRPLFVWTLDDDPFERC
ncbi:MAG: hypothetical protein ACK4RK_08575 [Gemmataceae bacterium]